MQLQLQQVAITIWMLQSAKTVYNHLVNQKKKKPFESSITTKSLATGDMVGTTRMLAL